MQARVEKTLDFEGVIVVDVKGQICGITLLWCSKEEVSTILK